MRTQGRLTCNCAFCCCSQRSPTPVGLTAEVREHCDGLRTSCPAGVQQHSSSKAAGLSGPSNELMLRRRDVDHTWRGRRYCCAAAPCAPARGAVPIWAARESRGRGWAPARPRGGAAVPDPARRAGASAPVFSRTLYSRYRGLFGLLFTLRTMLIIWSSHLTSQTGWNRCNLYKERYSSLSIYLPVNDGVCLQHGPL